MGQLPERRRRSAHACRTPSKKTGGAHAPRPAPPSKQVILTYCRCTTVASKHAEVRRTHEAPEGSSGLTLHQISVVGRTSLCHRAEVNLLSACSAQNPAMCSCTATTRLAESQWRPAVPCLQTHSHARVVGRTRARFGQSLHSAFKWCVHRCFTVSCALTTRRADGHSQPEYAHGGGCTVCRGRLEQNTGGLWGHAVVPQTTGFDPGGVWHPHTRRGEDREGPDSPRRPALELRFGRNLTPLQSARLAPLCESSSSPLTHPVPTLALSSLRELPAGCLLCVLGCARRLGLEPQQLGATL